MRTTLMLLLILLTGFAFAEPPGETEDPEAGASESPAAEGTPESEPSEDEDGKSEADEEARESAPPAALERSPSARFDATDVNPERRKWVGEPISLSLKDADIVEVLRSFAKLTDANLVIDPKVQGKVTVELKDVPWDQALDAILRVHDLGIEVSGNVWSLMPADHLYKD